MFGPDGKPIGILKLSFVFGFPHLAAKCFNKKHCQDRQCGKALNLYIWDEALARETLRAWLNSANQFTTRVAHGKGI